MNKDHCDETWRGLSAEARGSLETRDYDRAPLAAALGTSGLPASEVFTARQELREVWIPGVELLPRRVFQQAGRGYFAELTRLSEGRLAELGLSPRQWASALMVRGSAKGFHIHPPFVPDGHEAEDWFSKLYGERQATPQERPYDREQWDVMFFLTSICEILLVDERAGLPRRVMRFTIFGDSMPGAENFGVVIPPGVAHALRNIGGQDVVMVYGTSTVFNPAWEGRIASGVEQCPLPPDWRCYLEPPGGGTAS